MPHSTVLRAETLPLSGLVGYYRNPRKGDVPAIATSLRINGQYRQIVVNEGTLTGRPLEVLAGNHTVAAARELGWEDIKVVLVDVDEEAAARIVAADNRTADRGSYDEAALVDLLQGIGDLEGTGYSDDYLDTLVNPPPAKPPKPGHVEDPQSLRVGSLAIDLSDEEFEKFVAVQGDYLNTNGTTYGLIGWLLSLVDVDDLEEAK